MPEEGLPWLKKDQLLSDEEIQSLYNEGQGRSLQVIDTDPSNNATLVPINSVLSWTLKAPMDVAGYDVYFGTDPNLTASEKVVDHELVNNVDPFDEYPMDFDTTYYWRVDVNEISGELHTGLRLSFTTVPETPILNPDLPECTAVDAGDDVVFTVEATNPWTNDGTGMTYAWGKVGEGGMLSTTDTLEILNAQLAQEGLY